MLKHNYTEIRVYMFRQGLSLAKIARLFGVTPPYIFQVLHSRRPALDIRQRLIRELGFPADLIAYRPAPGRRQKRAA